MKNPILIIIIAASIMFALPAIACASSTSTSVPEQSQPKKTATMEPIKTSIPQITNTPNPTNTPEPTETQEPTAIPTDTPPPQIYTGSDDSLIDIQNIGAALIHIVGNSSSRYFSVTGYDSNNEAIDLLVNTTDPYDGVRPLDFMKSNKTARLEIKAVGEWTIEILPLSSIEVLTIPGQISGKGDYVFAIKGGAPDTAEISGNTSGRYFSVTSYGDSVDLLVNTTDPYKGIVLLDRSTFLIEISAADEWSIIFTAK